MPVLPVNTASLATIRHGREVGVTIFEPALPQLQDGDHVLDVGAGLQDNRALGALLLRNAGVAAHVTRLDYFAENMQDGQREHPLAADARTLPVRSGSIKAVVTSELTLDNPLFSGKYGAMSWHLEQRKQVTSQIVRVLGIGGHWIAHNEDFRPEDLCFGDRPAGIVTRYQGIVGQQIARGITSGHLSFGVFEKIANAIDPSLLGKNARMLFGRYSDAYTRTLNETYTPDTVIGADLKDQLLNTMAAGRLDTLNMGFKEGSDSESLQFLARAAKSKRWLPSMYRVPKGNPTELLDMALSPSGEDDAKNGTHPFDPGLVMHLHNTLFTLGEEKNWHVVVHKKHIVLIPKQQFLDWIIDRQTLQRVRTPQGMVQLLPGESVSIPYRQALVYNDAGERILVSVDEFGRRVND